MFQSDDQWKYFIDTGVWPKRNQFAPQEWINNFDSDEKKFARRLLEKFTYFSEDMVKQLFKSSFVSLSKYILTNKADFILLARELLVFLDYLYILRVTGEDPSDADSGYIFTRSSRDVLGIPETQIITSQKFVEVIQYNPEASFVFVDDFVGSGNQFISFWHQQEILPNITFQKIYEHFPNRKFFYCPAICTQMGYNLIRKCCPVKVLPAHLYTELHSALNPESYIWRDFSKDGPDFIKEISMKVGIPELENAGVIVNADGTKIVSWQGYLELGLVLGFSHGWPDATLPLFYHNEGGFKPLLKKGEL